MITVELRGTAELQRRLAALEGVTRGDALSAGLRAAAFVVEGHAKRYSRVDTGFMRNSIYTKTDKFSGYQQARLLASQENPEGVMLPETSLPAVASNEQVAVVACGAEYGVYNEYSTSRMSAQPFMRPAIENHRSELDDAFRVNVMAKIEGALR